MKVLFVVTAFYPEQAIGSVRISKFAKYFAAAGVDLTIISLTPPSWSKKDETLRFDGLENIRWVQIDQSYLFKRIFQRARSAAVGGKSALGYMESSGTKTVFKKAVRSAIQLAYALIKGLDWKRQVTKYAATFFDNEQFDSVFCSYPSFGSPLAAIGLRKAGYCRNVVLDFRDPVVYGDSFLKKAQENIQQSFLCSVDGVTFVSEGVKEKVLTDSIPIKKSLVVYNGFDTEDCRNYEYLRYIKGTNTALKFSYVGSLYGGKRNLNSFFSVIKNCIDLGEIKLRSIELHYAGADLESLMSQAESFGLQNIVVDHGLITRDDALGLQSNVDVNIVVTWNTPQDQGVLTGKVFESFMLRKPILGIVNGTMAGSEFSRMINSVGAGFCIEDANIDRLRFKGWLVDSINLKLKNGILPSTYNDVVNEYNYSSLAGNLMCFVREINHNNKIKVDS